MLVLTGIFFTLMSVAVTTCIAWPEEGTVNDEILLKPLPDTVVNETEADSPEHFSDFALLQPDALPTTVERQQTSGRRKRSLSNEDVAIKKPVPPIVYIETLVFVDYSLYNALDKDDKKIKRYVLSFWNAVDSRYRSFSSPKVRISVVGINILKTPTEYFEKNRVNGDAFDASAVLDDFGKHLFRAKEFSAYDIAVIMTKLDLCSRYSPKGHCARHTAGFATQAGACSIMENLEKVSSVAVVEDSGGFSGINFAAHEIGHLLGASHDGEKAPRYFNGPGGERCYLKDNYMMSYLKLSENNFRWSPCSEKSIYHFLNSGEVTCLFNKPYQDLASVAPLPGTLLSLDEQCEKQNGTSRYKDERVCVKLFCFNKKTGEAIAYGPAADGSPCGDNKHCLAGKCIPK